MLRSGKPRQDYHGIALVAPATVPYIRYSNEAAHYWLSKALRSSLDAAGLKPDAVDGLCVSSFTLAPDTAVGFTQHVGLDLRWLDHIPMGGASGVVAMRRAARAVQSGDASIVACIAGDTNQISSMRHIASQFSRFAQDGAYPYGAGGPNAYFALITDHYVRKYGVNREVFAKMCVAQRENALSYPYALMKKPLTIDDYMKARPISDPITLYDCVMPCAGGEAFLVMHEEAAVALGLPFVRILATIERHNAFKDDIVQDRGGWVLDIDEFWECAGVRPDCVDFLQTYDDYPVISLMQIEDLGFCRKGEAAAFVEEHDLTVNGSFPHNTSGGQLSVGQAGAAGGYLGLVEAIRQLTASTLGAQCAGASLGVVSGFGMVNYDRGVCTAAAALARA